MSEQIETSNFSEAISKRFLDERAKKMLAQVISALNLKFFLSDPC
jgi:hypothetical protein